MAYRIWLLTEFDIIYVSAHIYVNGVGFYEH